VLLIYLVFKHGCEEELADNQRGNQNPYIEEEQITQWPKEKVQRRNSDLQNTKLFIESINFSLPPK
jgi:hypothetical protein